MCSRYNANSLKVHHHAAQFCVLQAAHDRANTCGYLVGTEGIEMTTDRKRGVGKAPVRILKVRGT
jgi:hypothetical protein